MNLDWHYDRDGACPQCVADVPQAEWCLDAPTALERLEPKRGWEGDPSGATVAAVRWRPGTALEVTYAWHESDRPELLVARFASNRRSAQPNLHVQLTRFADDPLVRDTVGGDWSVLAYEPGRRATLLVRRSEGDHVAKFGGNAPAAHRRQLSLAGARCPVPEPIGCDPERNVRFESFVAGGDFWRTFRSDPGSTLSAAFASLAALHRHVPPDDVPNHDPATTLDRTRAVALRRLRKAGLGTADCVAVVDRLASWTPSDSPPGTLHGDFHPGNVVVSDGQATLVDLDEVSTGDPTYDVAMFTSRIVLWALLEPTVPDELGALVATAHERYSDHAGRPIDAARYAWYLAALLIGRQVKTSVTHAAPRLDLLCKRLTALADEIADRMRVDADAIQDATSAPTDETAPTRVTKPGMPDTERVTMPTDTAQTQRSGSEQVLIERLRAGDESAFVEVVTRLGPSMVRLARTFVPTQAIAEEVVQDSWVGVLNGIDRFEGRSSLRTWVMQIVANQAIRRGERERRMIPFSSLAARDAGGDEPAVDADSFLPPDHQWAGHWAAAPRPFPEPDQQVLTKETMSAIKRAIDQLPEAQRAVITLRDIEGWSADEVCAQLAVSDGNQRVLLHRARGKVRQALEAHYAGTTE